MKEVLINELAEQAGIEPVAIHNNPLVVSYHMSHETMDKFVELIVRECAEVVRIQNEQFMANESHYGVVSADILKHFGVEE